MEVVSTIISIVEIVIAVKEAVDAAQALVESVDDLVVTFRKTVDDFKNTITEVVVIFDSDGDGTKDSEQVVYRIYQMLPDYETGFCICNKDDEIGLGLPMFEIIDGKAFPELLAKSPSVPLSDLPVIPDTSDEFPDISDIIDIDIPSFSKDYPVITGNDKYFLADLYDDGSNDIISPGGDITGDGINDWLVIVDNDDNGLPDASPNAVFYPVGSEAFNDLAQGLRDQSVLLTPDGIVYNYSGSGDDIVSCAESAWVDKYGSMDKPLHNYSVSEALLFIIACGTVVSLLCKVFKRRKM